MIFYIVSAVALLIAALIVIDGFKTWGKKSGFMRIGVTAVVLFLGLWFFGFILHGIAEPTHKRVFHKTVKQPIVSMRSAETIEGRFTLATGVVHGYRKYYFMRDLGDGYYEESWVRVNVCRLRETNDETPCFSYDWYRSEPRWWLLPDWFPYTNYEKYNFLLTIPEGSIIKEFRPN